MVKWMLADDRRIAISARYAVSHHPTCDTAQAVGRHTAYDSEAGLLEIREKSSAEVARVLRSMILPNQQRSWFSMTAKP